MMRIVVPLSVPNVQEVSVPGPIAGVCDNYANVDNSVSCMLSAQKAEHTQNSLPDSRKQHRRRAMGLKPRHKSAGNLPFWSGNITRFHTSGHCSDGNVPHR